MQAIGLIGSVIGGIGSMMQANAAAQQASYQAAIARVNAQQEKYNAEAASHAAEIDIQDMGQQTAGERGQLISNQAASGLNISSPSFLSGVAAYSANKYEETVRRQFEGNSQMASYLTRSNVETARAQASDAAAASYSAMGGINMMSSIIGGFSSLVGGSSSFMGSPSYMSVSSIRSAYG